MLLPHGTMIALVDGERFELYRNTGTQAHPELSAVDTPQLDETNRGSGGHHFSSAGNPQESLIDEDAHAAAVADWLNGQVLAHKVENLVVIAPPRTLGELRRHYHKQLQAVLLGELAKELVGRNGSDIVVALSD